MSHRFRVEAPGTDVDEEVFDDYIDTVHYLQDRGYIVGHSGDISEDGGRTLFWSSASDSEDDPGALAAGKILREED